MRTIEVIQADIDMGADFLRLAGSFPKHTASCPVALATARALGREVFASGEEVFIEGQGIPLPDVAVNWIARFDSQFDTLIFHNGAIELVLHGDEPIEPFSFELDYSE